MSFFPATKSSKSTKHIYAFLGVGAAVATSIASLQGCSPDEGTTIADAGRTPQDAGSAAQDSGSNVDANVSPVDGGSDAGKLTQSEAYCAAYASHGTCPNQTPSACRESDKCIFGKMSPAAASAFNDCYAAPSCKSQDACMVIAGKAIADPGASKFITDCKARYTSCGGGFDDENCSETPFAWPGIGAAAQACVEKPCGEIGPCMQALADTLEVCP